MQSTSPALECELSPAARQDMASHIGREESASAVASSARVVAGLHLFANRDNRVLATSVHYFRREQAGSKSCARSGHSRTVIQAPQSSIWLVLCVLGLPHCVLLSIRVRLGAGLHTGQASACRLGFWRSRFNKRT